VSAGLSAENGSPKSSPIIDGQEVPKPVTNDLVNAISRYINLLLIILIYLEMLLFLFNLFLFDYLLYVYVSVYRPNCRT
jgi:hypothetical protein